MYRPTTYRDAADSVTKSYTDWLTYWVINNDIVNIPGINKNWKEEPYPTPTQPPTTPPTKPPVTKKPILPPKKTDKPDSCDTSYDALSVIRREIYIFKGKVSMGCVRYTVEPITVNPRNIWGIFVLLSKGKSSKFDSCGMCAKKI